MTEPENLHAKFANLEQLLATQHGELLDALSGLSTKLSQVIGAIGAISISGTNMGPTNAILDEMADLLGTISTSIGVPDADLPVNALTWLDHIAANTLRSAECCEESGGSPPASGIGGCTAPVTSTGIRSRQVFIAPSGGNPGLAFSYNVATFTIPISDDLTGDTGLGAQWEDAFVAPPRDGWDGWRVYVQSDAPSYTDDPDGIPIYPVSTWRPLTGTTSRMFSVSPPHQIKVFLCPPGDTGGGPLIDCTVFASVQVGVLPRENTKLQFDAIIPPAEFSTDNDITFAGFPTYAFQENIVILDDLYGWSVGLVDGPLFYVAGVAEDGSTISVIKHEGEGGYVFNLHTQRVIICTELNTGTPDEPFSVELCPPSPM